jgi:hypothetical protein
VERVQCDNHKPNRVPAGNSHEDVAFPVRTARPNGLRLTRLPVWVQAEKDLITQYIPHGGKHGCPRAQRELNDGLKVIIAELADLDSIRHDDRTLATYGEYRVGQRSGLSPEFARRLRLYREVMSRQAWGNALAGLLFFIIAIVDFTRDSSGIGVVFLVFAAVFLGLAFSARKTASS